MDQKKEQSIIKVKNSCKIELLHIKLVEDQFYREQARKRPKFSLTILIQRIEYIKKRPFSIDVMSNSWLPRKKTRGIEIRSSRAAEEQRTREIDKKNFQRKGQEYLYGVLYKDKDTSNPPDTSRIPNKVFSSYKAPDYDPMRLHKLIYDEIYEFSPNAPPTNPNQPKNILKYDKNHPEHEINKLKNEIPTLVIPLNTSNESQRPKTTRDKKNKKKSINEMLDELPFSARKPKPDRAPRNLNIARKSSPDNIRSSQKRYKSPKKQKPKAESPPNTIIQNISREVVQIQTSLLPLYLFDDDSYDAEIIVGICDHLTKSYLYGYSLYCYNQSDLEWRSCKIVGKKGDKYIIKWDDFQDSKEVYRISLRFEFDDPDRFDLRRRQAFFWRNQVEGEMKLISYLRSTAAGDFPLPSSEVLSSILTQIRLKEEMVNTPRTSELVQEIMEEFVYGERVAHYIDEWSNEKLANYYRKKGFPPYSIREIEVYSMGFVDPSRLKLPPVLQMIRISFKLDQMRQYRLISTKIPKLVTIEDFYTINMRHLQCIRDQVRDFDLPLIDNVIEKLVNEPHSPKCLKMIRLRLADVFIEIINESFLLFKEQIETRCYKFIVEVTNDRKVERIKLDDLNILCDSIMSNMISLLSSFDIDFDLEEVQPTYDLVFTFFKSMMKTSFKEFMIELNRLNEVVKPIPNDNFMLVDDLIELQRQLLDSSYALDSFRLDFFIENDFNNIHVSFLNLNSHLEFQHLKFLNSGCKMVSDKIVELVGDVVHSINDLKERCSRTPNSIEEWHKRHVLLNNLELNFSQIRKDVESTISMFDFLDTFSYEAELKFPVVFNLKANLLSLHSRLPEFFEQEKMDMARFREEHRYENGVVNGKIVGLHARVATYHKKDNLEERFTYFKDLRELRKEADLLKEEMVKAIQRDEMIGMEISEYPQMNEIESDLNIFTPLWRIARLLVKQVDEWLPQPFLQLDPNLIFKTFKEWEAELFEIQQKIMNKLFFISQQEAGVSTHPLIAVIIELQSQIEIHLSRMPILQHLCTPSLRSRHWMEITNITGELINPNQGLTWHWVIETNIQRFISEIAEVARSAQFEFKIEKALIEMINNIYSISVKIKEEGNKLKIDDALPIFDVLTQNQLTIQELFVPPYHLPFLSKIREYDNISKNLREIINKILATQCTITDIAPAMESQDTKAQSQETSQTYENSIQTYNKFMTRFQDPSRFHDLVTNPKYVNVVKTIQGSFEGLKEDLDNIIKAKKQAFPYFQLLSDEQLITIISYSHMPDVFKTYFNFIYPNIKEAIFERNKFCMGFISNNNETVNFSRIFEVAQDSIETTFDNFDLALIQTIKMTTLYLINHKNNSQNKFPQQSICLAKQENFTSEVESIFKSGNINFYPLLDQIQDELTSSNEINIISILMKERDILNELIEKKVDSKDDYSWLKHIRYYTQGDSESDFDLKVSIGLNECKYGFNYIGNSPRVFITNEIEKTFTSFMTSKVNHFHVMAPQTELIRTFLEVIGQNYSIFSCSGFTNESLFTSLLVTARETKIALIFEDIRLIPKDIVASVLPHLASSIMNKKKDRCPTIYFSYPCSPGERIPQHIRFLFRNVTLDSVHSKQGIEAMLRSLGLDKDQELIQQIEEIVLKLAPRLPYRFSHILSLSSVFKILANFSPDKLCDKLMEFDIPREFQQEIKKIFNKNDNENIDISINDQFIELVNHYRDVIVLGSTLTGKSYTIKTAAEQMNVNYKILNVNAQTNEYLNGGKQQGLLYEAINSNYKWVILDSAIDFVLPITGTKICFSDGSRLDLSEDFCFIYETDSVSLASPSLMNKCGLLTIPDDNLNYKDFINMFVNEISNDQRIVEKLSRKLIGTEILIDNFIKKVETTLNNLIPLILEKCEFHLSKSHLVYSYIKMLNSIIVSQYLVGVKANRESLFDHFDEISTFAAIWSFGGTLVDDERLVFEKQFKEISLANLPDKIFQNYFDNETKEWKNWSDLNLNTICEKEMMNTEMFYLSTDTLNSSLYLFDCLTSQGQSILLNSVDNRKTSILIHAAKSLKHVGTNFVTLISRHGSVRNMISEVDFVGTKLPLFALEDRNLEYSSSSELIREILDQNKMTNLESLSDQNMKGDVFIITSQSLDNANMRMLRHMTLLRFKEINTERMITKSIELLLKVENYEKIARILLDYTSNLSEKLMFNHFHLLQVIWRVAQGNENIIESFAKELTYTYYMSTSQNDILAKLNMAIRTLARELKKDQYNIFDVSTNSFKDAFNSLLNAPKSHILLISEVVPFTEEYAIFNSGDNLMSKMQRAYSEAGKSKKHMVIVIEESQLNSNDLDMLKSLIVSTSGLLKRNDIISTLSEIYCKDIKDDPFHEDTLEALPNFHVIYNNYLNDCKKYFHICLITNPKSNNFDFYVERMVPIRYDQEKIKAELHFSIHYEDTTKLQKEYELLSQMSSLGKETAEKLNSTYQTQLSMENEVQELANQLNESMQQTEIASLKVKEEKKVLEAEKIILQAQELQAEQLRKESKESLSTTQPLLDQSTAELKSLSNIDISIIKSMNHPPKGVFLVMKAIVVIMGHKIEDKTDEPSGSQPSWILGKKIMSDPSFLNKLMSRALEGLTDHTIHSLQPFMRDANFDPSVVASSSSAAKSICKFIRAAIPYYFAMQQFNEKMKELNDCEATLSKLKKQHNENSDRLKQANEDAADLKIRSQALMEQKLIVESKLEKQRQETEKYKFSMTLMEDFFKMWNNKKDELEKKIQNVPKHSQFIKRALETFATGKASERDFMFSKIQKELGIVFESREELSKELIQMPINEFGLENLSNDVENFAMATNFVENWFLCLDPDNIALQFFRIIDKKITVTSFLASEFQNDLLNSILGNDLLIVYDYDVKENYHILHQVFRNKGTDLILGINDHHVNVPKTYQIIFIVDSFPEQTVFESLYIDLTLSNAQKSRQIASTLFTSLQSEKSHIMTSVVRSINDSNLELERNNLDLIESLLNRSRSILDDENVIKKFVSAQNIITRLSLHLEKLEENMKQYNELFKHFVFLSNQIIGLYEPNSGGFKQFLHELASSIGEDEDCVSLNLSKRLCLKESFKLEGKEKINYLAKQAHVKTHEYKDLVELLRNYYGPDIEEPKTTDFIIRESTNRKPIFLKISHTLLRYLTRNDKLIICPISNCLNGFTEAMQNGKMLATFITSTKQLKYVLSVQSKMISANSISQDFRFLIFTSERFAFKSRMLEFCDSFVIDSFINIRSMISYHLSCFPLSLFETNVQGMTNKHRRMILLLAMFETSANLMKKVVFSDDYFEESNLELITKYSKIENLAQVGNFVVDLYGSEFPVLQQYIQQIWSRMFEKKNLDLIPISLFGIYNIPLILVPSSLSEIFDKFPLLDSADSFCMHRQITDSFFIEMMREEEKFLVNQSKQVRWFLKDEANDLLREDVNDHNGLREIVRMDRPIIDLSLLIDSRRFINIIRKYKDIKIMLSQEPTEIPVSNLWAVNGYFTNGRFEYFCGMKRLGKMFLRTVNSNDARSMASIKLLCRGKYICDIYVISSQKSFDDVFIVSKSS